PMSHTPDVAYRRIVDAAVDGVDEAELRAAVDDALRQGFSWSTVAVALGTTRSEAQQRFRTPGR
ncbi:MAG: hypothetical protein WAV90_25080, partial [Gordonia amarae]